VGDIALLGGELEAARQAALLSLESEGITTVAEATAAWRDGRARSMDPCTCGGGRGAFYIT
jgi:hypothetical protein